MSRTTDRILDPCELQDTRNKRRRVSYSIFMTRAEIPFSAMITSSGRNDENGRRQQNNNHYKADETSLGRRESFIGTEGVRRVLGGY